MSIAAFPAGFVALVVPHLRSVDGRWAAAIGVALALILVPFAPAGVPILAATVAVLVGLRRPAAAARRRNPSPPAPSSPGETP